MCMWQKQNNQLYKEFTFKDFDEAFSFMQQVARVATRLDHHPKWLNEWNRVEFWLSTHTSGGVTEKDEELANEIDNLFEKTKPNLSNNETKLNEVKVYSDGGSRGNPGPSAGGYVILDMADSVVKNNGKFLGTMTNNQAEYHAIKGGLEAALEMGAKVVHVFMDSLLIVNQMKGIYKVKNQELLPIYKATKDLLPLFEEVEFTHVPRELNKLADAEVNKSLDAEAQSSK